MNLIRKIKSKKLKYIDLNIMYKNKKFSEDEIIETYEKNKKFYVEKKKIFLFLKLRQKI